ncbi:heme-dependent oxidative N-demethylase family protein [Tardiphaga sp.]|uniref:heme-dependent oxidative N-demethylase family protein n=1 Tax=Tardiphaga sp. TaxID=1926292 RepID=UPI0037DA0168
MTLHFKPDESYRAPYSFSNSREQIERYPFLFLSDHFTYSTNLEPHVEGPGIFEHLLDVDEHYLGEMAERRLLMAADPDQHYVSLPHSIPAQWEFMELIMESYARDYPEHFALERSGSTWTWTNRPLGITDSFTFGDMRTLGSEPLKYIGMQGQGDWILLEERDANLFWIAGLATSRAGYSLRFNVGMNFKEYHGPVPLAHESGVFERAMKFLVRLKPGHPFRRTNWNMTVNPRHNISVEATPEWANDWSLVTSENAGRLVHLRMEIQPIFRLPRTNAIAFPVRTYFASLEEIATNPAWARRLHRVVKTCPQEIVDYKGFTRFQQQVVDWLAPFDDGR